MQDKQPTLLLTRPKPQSFEFLALCETLAGRRLPVVVSPIIAIETRAEHPDLSVFATLIFTSANAVAAVVDDLRGRTVVTVGAKTCEVALQAGANAKCLGEDVNALIANANLIGGPALHCRGAHVRGDLAESLSAKGIRVDEVIVYDQVSQPLNQAAQTLLQGDGCVVAPLFSPRSAQLLSQNAIAADMQIIAMSAAVAEAWTGPGAKEIAAAPTAAEMAKCTTKFF